MGGIVLPCTYIFKNIDIDEFSIKLQKLLKEIREGNVMDALRVWCSVLCLFLQKEIKVICVLFTSTMILTNQLNSVKNERFEIVTTYQCHVIRYWGNWSVIGEIPRKRK